MRLTADHQSSQSTVRIRAINAQIPADISLPEKPQGLVVFGNGIGRGRHSPAQRRVAEILNAGGLATILADLLEDQPEVDRHSGACHYDLDLLEERVVTVTDWIAMQSALREMPLGYFGAGMGGAAALIAAAKRPEVVRALVSCGAQLDLIEAFLCEVSAPALFIVGGDDPALLSLHRSAMTQLPERTFRALEVIEGVTGDPMHDESTVVRVGDFARRWFHRFLSGETRKAGA